MCIFHYFYNNIKIAAMKNNTIFMLFILWLCLGCKSYSKHTIDEKPSIKVDTTLLGSWKAIGDTDNKNFILVQSFYDAYHNTEKQYHMSADFGKNRDYEYYITYFNRHGKNPVYGQWITTISVIDGVTFFNIGDLNSELKGYLLVRVISKDTASRKLTTAIVADTTLKYLKSSQQVRERITKNLNNPSFYSDTMHFYKVNNYHLSLNEAVKRAN